MSILYHHSPLFTQNKKYSFVPKRNRKLVIQNNIYQPKKVAILMGSPNDYEKMKHAKDTLLEIGLQPDVRVMSAHRQPNEVSKLAQSARDRGYAAIICGAGMAAHLAGAVASQTTLPVVGVPLSSSSLDGMDSLLSTVQMPKGIPVATVAIDNAENAALLVAQMLSINNKEICEQLHHRRQLNREKLNNVNIHLME